MIQRVAFGLIVVATLVLLILYSQTRTILPFVSGIVETDEIRLGSRVGGRVQKVMVNEGDRVTAGMTLVEFEPYDLLQREQQATAELNVRSAELTKLKTGLRAEEIGQAKTRLDRLNAQLKLLLAGPRKQEIAAARERLAAANADLKLAGVEYDRRADLLQTNSISKNEFDMAKERFDSAQANVEVRKNELSILESGARPEELEQAEALVEESRLAWELAKQGFRIEDIQQAQAAHDAAAAALDVIRQQKTELQVSSPTDGYVDALDLQVGDLVPANAPVLTLLAEDLLWIRAYVPQRFLQLSVGQKLKVSIDSLPGETFVGTVSFVSHQAEFHPATCRHRTKGPSRFIEFE